MTDKELQKELDDIRNGFRFFDMIINYDWDKEKNEEKFYINERQYNAIRQLLDLFQSLNWQLVLNEYKQLEYGKGDSINTRGCGTPVKVRPCAEKYNNKTYFGILIGEVPLSLHSSIDEEGNLTVSRSMYNPAIFVPELKEIIYGCGSWWGEIETEEALEKVITDETIENVWYMKLLKGVKDEMV